MARYDDELWELIPEDPGPPPAHLSEFVKELAPADVALDLGVGDGRLAAQIAATQLTGADVSQVALDRARKRLPDAELVLVQPDEPLPFPDHLFAELQMGIPAAPPREPEAPAPRTPQDPIGEAIADAATALRLAWRRLWHM